MPLNPEVAGRRYPPATYEVTAEAIRKYAAATNEENPRLAGWDPVAPPAFPIVPAARLLNTVLTDPDLGANPARLIHKHQEHRLNAAIRPGDVLEIDTWLDAVDIEDTGETFTVATKLINQEGVIACEFRSVMFIRGTAKRRGSDAWEPANPEPVFEVEQKVDEDQTFRYAEASGDISPIHLDAEFARNSAGLPGIILHGMCTMAFAAKAVLDSVCDSNPERLRKIGVRFARPVFPGETLTTVGWVHAEGDGAVVYRFETSNGRGSAVLTHGEAEVATGSKLGRAPAAD